MTPKTRKPAANSAKQQRGRPFPKGVSGNPAGRPLGSRHKVTLAVEALLDGQHVDRHRQMTPNRRQIDPLGASTG
jgi:hypothetical protein